MERIKNQKSAMEALEGKGYRLPLMKGEIELVEKLPTITKQLKGLG